MECPNCHKEMRVTHVYKTDAASRVRRCECETCQITGNSIEVLFDTDPLIGNGAHSVSNRLQAQPKVIEEIKEVVVLKVKSLQTSYRPPLRMQA